MFNLCTKNNFDIDKNSDFVIVDDDAFMLEHVRRGLKHTSATLRCYSCPGYALEQVVGHLPRIMLIDFHMPRMNGVEFLSLLRASDAKQSCTFFMCSSYKLPSDVEIEALQHGARLLSKDRLIERGCVEKLYLSSVRSHVD